jgi:hypothetical protein
MEIEDGVYRAVYGVVEFTTPDYMVSSYGGDSGGPVFTPPVWNASVGRSDISGAGLLVGGETKPNYNRSRPCITGQDGACPSYYMPIDRINDKIGVVVVTASGTASP